MNAIEKKVWDLSKDIVESEGCILYLVEFVKEGKDRILRIMIDSDEGVDINQCENISRTISDILDEVDPISVSYMLEVSSAGLGRKLVLPWHFEKYNMKEVDLRLFASENGGKKHTGLLKKRTDDITVIISENTELVFNNKNVSAVNLHFDF